MKKNNIVFVIITILIIMFGFVSVNNNVEGFVNFDKSKNILEKEIYTSLTGTLDRVDFYCGCNYDKNKNINNQSCGFKSLKDGYKSRGKKIEWEHIVPAENFGRGFIEWREGTKKCIKKGKQIKGRGCAKTNPDFNKMEGDIYNLYPVVGEINAIRSNYDYYVFSTGSIIHKGKIFNYQKCEYIVDTENKIASPKNNIKGDIARVYFYFENKYPKYFKISDKNRKVYNLWSKIDPVSNEECKRYIIIKNKTGEENNILKDLCK